MAECTAASGAMNCTFICDPECCRARLGTTGCASSRLSLTATSRLGRGRRPKGGWVQADIAALLRNIGEPKNPSRAALPTAVAVAWLERWRQTHRPPVYRPGSYPTHSLPAQRIPRRIFQTVKTDAAATVAASPLIRTWLTLNPEYEYHLLEEVDCQSFVDTVGTASQRQAYRSLATGAGRSDMFRVLILLHLGGVEQN